MPSRPKRDYEGIPLDERPVDHVTNVLARVLGPSMVAFCIGERNPERIRNYRARREIPDEEQDRRLRDLAVVTDALLANESDASVRAIMIGSNPLLDDRAPAEVLHLDESRDIEALKENASRLAG